MTPVIPAIDWQAALQDVISDPRELWRLLELDPRLLSSMVSDSNDFVLRVPRSFVARMERGNPRDPLLLQILPTSSEDQSVPGFTHDPLNEKQFNPLPGLLHKYQGRVLITLSGSCAVNCRYCFRRHFPYPENNPGKNGWTSIFNYLKNDPTITEVILSGGDPLLVKDSTLSTFIAGLEKIPSLQRLRFHTRFPVVIPERITPELMTLLKKTTLRTSLVFHINHPNEINNTFKLNIEKLRETKTILLNQSVLLKNINDHAETLIKLSECLFDIGILPYYLHLLDPVHGTAHFQVSDDKAKSLITEMTHQLPGYLIPKLVREVPGAYSKTRVI